MGAANETAFQTDAADFIQTHLYKYVLWYFLLTCENLIYLPFMLQVARCFSKACIVQLLLDRTLGHSFDVCFKKEPVKQPDSINSSLNEVTHFFVRPVFSYESQTTF